MDDVIQAKVATIERCLKRIEEEAASDWKTNYTHQDALLLNLIRACQATIDFAAHIAKRKHLGVPKITGEFFSLLEDANIISTQSASGLRKMVGF